MQPSHDKTGLKHVCGLKPAGMSGYAVRQVLSARLSGGWLRFSAFLILLKHANCSYFNGPCSTCFRRSASGRPARTVGPCAPRTSLMEMPRRDAKRASRVGAYLLTAQAAQSAITILSEEFGGTRSVKFACNHAAPAEPAGKHYRASREYADRSSE